MKYVYFIHFDTNILSFLVLCHELQTRTQLNTVKKFAEKFVAYNEMMNEGKKSVHNVALLIPVL